MSFFKAFTQLFGKRMSAEDEYLSQASDLADLERRQRQLQYGTVKFFPSHYGH